MPVVNSLIQSKCNSPELSITMWLEDHVTCTCTRVHSGKPVIRLLKMQLSTTVFHVPKQCYMLGQHKSQCTYNMDQQFMNYCAWRHKTNRFTIKMLCVTSWSVDTLSRINLTLALTFLLVLVDTPYLHQNIWKLLSELKDGSILFPNFGWYIPLLDWTNINYIILYFSIPQDNMLVALWK